MNCFGWLFVKCRFSQDRFLRHLIMFSYILRLKNLNHFQLSQWSLLDKILIVFGLNAFKCHYGNLFLYRPQISPQYYHQNLSAKDTLNGHHFNQPPNYNSSHLGYGLLYRILCPGSNIPFSCEHNAGHSLYHAVCICTGTKSIYQSPSVINRITEIALC